MKCCKDRSVSLFLLLKSRFDLNTISVVFVEIEKAKNPLRYPPSPISSFFLRVRVGGGEKGELLLFFHAFEIMVGEIAAATMKMGEGGRKRDLFLRFIAFESWDFPNGGKKGHCHFMQSPILNVDRERRKRPPFLLFA